MIPFSEQYDDMANQELVREACQGSQAAIEKLVKIHQRFIYNIALKMVRDVDDAEDLTQEVLIKMVTKLTQFQFRSSFRTWLYRMVMNHFISTQRKKAETEVYSFDELGVFVDEVHNNETMTNEEQDTYKDEILHVRNRCMASTLLCLDRQQRIVIILGAIFNLKSQVAAQLLDITPENFRQQLSRAKHDLFQFMENKCGLINPANPCRCYKKTKGFIKEGKVDPDSHLFTDAYKQSIAAVIGEKNLELNRIMEGKYLYLFTEQPYEDTVVGDKLINSLLVDPDIKKLFHLN
jgi:RNA polymerase sigma factor (sigma-70 family)